eukprot:m.230543 g.230543  ORF g.230543 m.230543 type:complete len:107 (+) comp17060_c3_seq10:1503-1823(+)
MAATAPRSIWSRRTFFWEDPVETRRGVQPFAHNCGFSCFDPNLEQWSSSMLHMEIVAKQSCQTLLYYISAATRGIGSMIEASKVHPYEMVVMRTEDEEHEAEKQRK